MLMDLGEGARPARKAISTIDDVRHRQSPGNLRPLLQALFLTYWETWENALNPLGLRFFNCEMEQHWEMGVSIWYRCTYTFLMLLKLSMS